MSIAAGWYQDPADSSQLRYWDGESWTEQTTWAPPTSPPAPAAVPYGTLPAAAPSFAPVDTPSRWKRPLSGRVVFSSIAAVVVIAGGVGWGASAMSASSKYPPGCVTPVPAGASPAAVAYINALNKASPAWSYVDAHLGGFSTNRTKALRAQADADATFVKYLKRIDFGPQDEDGDGPALIDLVSQYRELILKDIKGVNDTANLSKEDALLAQRQQTSSELRNELNLPRGACTYNRPG